MPYVQFDLGDTYPDDVKRALANEVGSLFADVMQAPGVGINIAFRELGAANLHRWRAGELEPVAVILADVRRGRPPEQRERFARALVATAARHLGLEEGDIVVEFTQHAADEMFRDGALAQEWSAGS